MKTKIILIIILLLISVGIFANHDRLLRDIERKYESVKTFEAELTMTRFYGWHDMVLTSSGKMYIDNGTYIVEFTTPDVQFLKLQNGMLYFYDKANNAAMIQKMEAIGMAGMINFATILNLNQRYEYVATENGLLVFDVSTPEQNGNSNLRIFVNQRDLLVQRIEIKDELDQSQMNFEIGNQRFNGTLSKRASDFVIPANATMMSP
jgi:outer membrane lipoprotein-sorting protein